MAGNLGILGRKVGMTRIFSEDGSIVPVTVVAAGPCPVIQKKTLESDGYSALQVGFEPLPERKVTKPMRGHFAKAGKGNYRTLREFRLADVSGYEVGQELTAIDMFKPGDLVDVVGTSKGKGFQGVMKRHHFSGMRDSHGAEKVHRSPGSTGNRTWPGRIMKNKKEPGQMGNRRVTCRNLQIVDVLAGDNVILIRGQVPGASGSLVLVKKQG